ncbi:MAG: metallophosphoesterase [Prolixibacteraceae bacterium]|nr:metallophosphoesterase [Prolixibacteraceae bacterium]
MKNNYIKILVLILGIIFNFSEITSVKAQEQKICVISDVHYFDPSLLVEDGTAFQTYLLYDRKLLKESQAILESVVDSLIAEKPDLVIVSGDLTKDGELISHQKLAAYFQKLEESGIQVIVTPGNHDINNPHAVSFKGAETESVATVSPSEFTEIYADYGFKQARVKDTESLSYVYDVTDSLTIIAMDACRYDSNFADDYPKTSGGFEPVVLNWIVKQISDARAQGRTVMGVMHHGLVEHYTGQSALFSEYVIENWDSVSTVLADAGMNVVFTGHYHAHDISFKTTQSGGNIYDVETGATVTYPCPYRVLNYSTDRKLTISTKLITKINFDTGDLNFQDYALKTIQTGLPPLVRGIVMSAPFFLNDSVASLIEPAITESFIAHYYGNEGTPSVYTQYVIDMLLADPNYQMVGYALMAIWNDDYKDDWATQIQLEKPVVANVDNLIVSNAVAVYPNPTTGTLTLKGDFESNSLVKIFNINGNLVFSCRPTSNVNTYDLNLAKGIYIIEIQEKNTIRKKLVID